MIRPPPRSPPFPTRRSSDLVVPGRVAPEPVDVPRVADALKVDIAHLVDLPGDGGGDRAAERVEVGAALGHVADPHEAGRDDRVDRKSTRLNSSHSQISYAVF